MKAAIILQLLALPAILAKLTVQVVSKPMYMDVTVEGKRETDGQEITMDPSMFGEAGKVAQCLDENSAWTTSCDGQPSYLKVAEFNFDKETTDPRHFTVHTPSWMNSVSYISKYITMLH